MDINNLLVVNTDSVWYSEGFRAVLEDHMNLIRTASSTSKKELPNNLAWRYEGDFYGLMVELNVPFNLHWLCMRLVGYKNPQEMSASLEFVYVPDTGTIGILQTLYSTQTGLS